MGVLITLIALNLVIFFHELGHMWMAKKSGVGVEEFSIGFGPKIYSWTMWQTSFSFRLLPLGGYVKLAGMENWLEGNTDHPDQTSHFYNKPLIHRFGIIAAGPFMNILLAYLLFVGIIFSVGIPHLEPVIENVLPNSPAVHAGLQVNDRIVSVNDRAVQDIGADIITPIKEALDTPIKIGVERNGEQKILSIVPADMEANKTGRIGVQFKVSKKSVSMVQSLQGGGKMLIASIKNIGTSFKMIFSKQVSLSELSGPIGIIQMASVGFSHSIIDFLQVLALINVSLGVLNLLPFPVLDGGHIVFLLIEGLTKGRGVSKKAQVVLTNIGASILLSLTLLFLVNDILNWSDRMTVFKQWFGGP